MHKIYRYSSSCTRLENSEDEPSNDGPNYEIKETDPEDVKNWKKTCQEEIAEEKRAAAALAEEEAAALAETRRVEEKRQAAVETAGQTEQKTMKKRDWMSDMKDVMRREADWEEEKATRRKRRDQQDVEDNKRRLLAKKDGFMMATNGHGMKWKP